MGMRSRPFGVGSSCVPPSTSRHWRATVSRPGGRGVARPRRGRSGLRRTGCWCEPGRGDLSVQGNREQTADGPGNRAQARVKRCGKSAPALGATSAARQPPPGARSNVGGPVRPISPGRPHRWMATSSVTARDPRHRTPPTSRLTVTTSQARTPPGDFQATGLGTCGLDQLRLVPSDSRQVPSILILLRTD